MGVYVCPYFQKLLTPQGLTRTFPSRNQKSTYSDMEDDTDSDEDVDPANWFHDEEDDGIKGQQIIEPDVEDYTSIIRIDESKAYAGYSTFFEPRDGD